MPVLKVAKVDVWGKEYVSQDHPIIHHRNSPYSLEVIIIEFFAQLLTILDKKMVAPIPYGEFHILFIVLSILIGFLVAKHCPYEKESFIRRFLLIESIIVIILEIYKQINFSFYVEGNQIVFDYQWYVFPFQFCSTPMYIGLLAAIIKNKFAHRCLCSYLVSYAMFAGICVMAYPTTVFVDTIGINIQTMVCHGSMITVGIVLFNTGYVKAELKTLFSALPIFLLLVMGAATMNEVAYQTGLLSTDTFNMFFISPYCSPELPVYAQIQPIVPFPLSVLIYIAGFTAGAGILLLVGKALQILTVAPSTRRSSPQLSRKQPLIH